jgi:hypothetical protein
MMVGKAPVRVHRLAWELFRGPIIKGSCVLHKCDNMLCFNPDHLFLGTRTENMKDKVEKGRQTKGERNGGSKLTEKSVREILSLKGIESHGVIAKRFNVSRPLVSLVLARKIWTHVRFPP